ncbi:MAG TPA: L-histidine N(alpha)-methyltransferase [Myxococcaceae bacterium]
MAIDPDLLSAVRQGLTAQPKRLPPYLFYDREGSQLFEAITELPEYYLTRSELQLFQAHGPAIAAAAGEVSAVVEFGSGSAKKTQVLLEALLRSSPKAAFVAVDVSAAAVEMTRATLRARFPSLEVVPIQDEFHRALGKVQERPGRKLVLFIGSSVGNFDGAEAVELLAGLRAAMRPGDALLLGTDLRKDPALLVPAYDDAQGVTARFNKNLLARINRELGGHFDPDAFRHVAVWNGEASRIEMHLESVRAQVVAVDGLEMSVRFERGERIHTESSYKYTPEMVEEILRRAGFQREHTWTDDRGLFAEHLARVK